MLYLGWKRYETANIYIKWVRYWFNLDVGHYGPFLGTPRRQEFPGLDLSQSKMRKRACPRKTKNVHILKRLQKQFEIE